jgi:phage N-6-adenine-methyltransferase
VKITWSTPQAVFDKLDAEFRFTIDLCADRFNRKCERFIPTSISAASDVLWEGVGFLNPPYGDAKVMGAFMAKAVRSTKDCLGTIIVAVVPTNTNAPWWHDWVLRADGFVRKKLSFVASNGKRGVPFTGHAIVVFREGANIGRPRVSSWEQPKRAST